MSARKRIDDADTNSDLITAEAHAQLLAQVDATATQLANLRKAIHGAATAA